MESWTEILDNDDSIDVAYLDFRKVFDLASHPHLIYKMSKYGIKNHVLDWVKAFLGGRTQRVVIRGTVSESFEVTSGVPQGSVLGPILFLIFINDLPLEIISLLSLFADDTKIFIRIISEMSKTHPRGNYGSEVLQRDLNSIMKWANIWKMEFNIDKCKVMHLGRLNPKHTYTMGGRNLAVTSEEKDLGVTFDERLEFNKHITGIVNKANNMVGMIKISFTYLDKEIFKLVYPVLVRSLLNYCVQIWAPYKEKYINQIESLQKRAVRLVPGMKNKTYEQRLDELNMTKLVERRFRGDMIETYKLMTNKGGLNSDILFDRRAERGDSELHWGQKIFRKRCEKEVRRNFLFSVTENIKLQVLF